MFLRGEGVEFSYGPTFCNRRRFRAKFKVIDELGGERGGGGIRGLLPWP